MVCSRFPVTLFFVLFFATLSFVCVTVNPDDNERLWFFLFFYSAGGGVLSLALRLWGEVVSRRAVAIVVNIAAHALWFCSSAYLSAIVVHDLDVTYIYSSVALCLLVVAAVFLLPFFRERNDIAMWKFSQQIVTYFAWALLVASVLAVGLSLLFLSFDKLFGFDITAKTYTYIDVFCFTLLAPVLMLQQIPDRNAIHSPAVNGGSNFSHGVIHYLFLPLLGAYLLTLYVYALRIMFTCQLPDGWVSSLVSLSMAGMLFLVYMLYPTRFADDQRFDKTVLKFLPLLVLPLLVLMSVGIARRIDDYGLTNARLYLVVFNAWCYAVCIGLALTRSRRIWWIPASFVVIGIAVSVGPQSIANIVKRSMVQSITESMRRHGYANLPLGSEGKRWIGQLSDKERESMQSKFSYLRRSYDRKVVYGLAEERHFSNLWGDDYAESVNEYINFTVNDDNSPIAIPQGSVRVLADVETREVKVNANGDITISVEWSEGKMSTFHTNIATLKRYEKDSRERLTLRQQGEAVYVVKTCWINVTGDNIAKTYNGYARGTLFLMH